MRGRVQRFARLAIGDIESVDRLAVRPMARIAQHARVDILRSFRAGLGPRHALHIARHALIQSVTDAMVMAHLLGRRRIHIETAPRIKQPVAAAYGFGSAYSGAVEFLKRRLSLSPDDLARLRRLYGPEAVRAVERATVFQEREVQKAVQEAVQEGLHVGAGTARVRAAMQGVGLTGDNPFVYETIFRTQNAMAYSAGQANALEDPDVKEIVDSFTYTTAGDDRVRPEHAALEGFTAPADDPIWDTHTPPLGYNSVPPETPVLTADGWKRIVDVRIGDQVFTHRQRLRQVRELHKHAGPDELVAFNVHGDPGILAALTPNHPVFTKRGWVNAAGLDESDEVLCVRNRGIFHCRLGNVDDIAEAERRYDGFVSGLGKMFAAAPDLKAQSLIRQIEVEPESGRGLVEPVGDPFGFKNVCELGFIDRHLLMGIGMPTWIESDGFSSCGAGFGDHIRTKERAGLAELRRRLLRALRVQSVVNAVGVAARSKGYTPMLEHTAERTEDGTGLFGDHGERGLAAQVIADRAGQAAGPSGFDLSLCLQPVSVGAVGLLSDHATSVDVVWRKVKSKWTVRSRSSVYNLAVRDDESYFADGVAMHNCRCARVPNFVDAPVATQYPPATATIDGRQVTPGPDPGWDFNPGAVFRDLIGATR